MEEAGQGTEILVLCGSLLVLQGSTDIVAQFLL
jgi:hypothetical protein